MKTYDEISRNVLEKRDEYLYKQRVKRKKLTQISAAVVCLMLVAGISYGFSLENRLTTQQSGNTTTNETGMTVTNPATTKKATDNLTQATQPTTFPTTMPDIYISENLTTTSSPELHYEIDWDRKSTPGKFRAVVLERDEYNCFGEYVYPFRPTEERATDRKATQIVSDKEIEQYEPNGTRHTTTVDIFSLEGFSTELAIGVKFENDDRIYTYVNNSYQPETLGEFLEAVDYDNTVTYGGITLYQGTVFPVNNENFKDIKKYLLSKDDAENVRDLTVSVNCVTASIYCRELGIENKAFKISEDGYISTNLIGYRYVFYVGKETVAEFLKNSYHITFDQIKEITQTTQPNAAYFATTPTTTSPARPPKSDESSLTTEGYTVVATAPEEVFTTNWVCGTELE